MEPKTTVRKTAVKKAVRRTTTKKAPARKTTARTTSSVSRKAPVVRTTKTPQSKGASGRTFLIGMIMFLILIGVSVAIGYSDKGPLDVEQTITLRKQNATPEEQQVLNNVPTQQQNTVPNGGLVGVGKAPKPVVEESTATTTDETASSTDATASSTEEVVEEQEVTPEEEPQVAGDTATEGEVAQ
jgi:hypothetical protein